jgi:hemerythrin
LEDDIVSEIKYGIAWNDDYKLGNEQVDAQHYRLFQLLSNLIGSCMDGTDIEKLRETLDFLVNYTVQHFNDEEALQIRYNFPDYDRHKQLHEAFKETVGMLVQKFIDSGSSAELSIDISKIVAQWLINHIKREDLKIGYHIRMLSNLQ